MKARHYIIQGKVQGVGFRVFTKQKANLNNVLGWVRNLPDGSVECFAQAEAGDLESFETLIHDGPSFGRVDQIEKTEKELEEFSSFEIR